MGTPYFQYGMILCFSFLIRPISGYPQTEMATQLKSQINAKKGSGTIEEVDLLNRLAEELYNYYPDSTRYYAFMALALGKSLNYSEGVIDSYRNLGGFYNRVSNYDSALYFLDLGLRAAKDHKYPKGQANVLSTKARTFEDLGYFSSAVEYYLRSLKIKEENNLTAELPSTLNNLGLLASTNKEYEKALAYFQRALEIREQHNQTQNLEPLLTNIALVYKDQKKYDKASELLEKLKSTVEKSQNTYLLSVINHNLGQIAIAEGNFAKSIEYLNLALKLDKEMDDYEGISADLLGLARAHVAASDYNQAFSLLQEALSIAETNQLRSLQGEIHELISKIYEVRKDGMNALYHHKMFKKIHDGIFNSDSIKVRKDLEERYQLEREEADFIQQQRERELAMENEASRLIRNGILVLLIIMTLALIISIRSVKIQRKARLQVTRQKDELERLYKETSAQKEEIESIAKNLEEVNKTKDRLFSIVSHDLRSPINSLNSLMQYTLDENLSQEEFLQISYKLKHEVEHVHFTLLNLLQWAKTQMRGITTAPSDILISELIADNLDLYSPIAQSKMIHIENKIPSETTCWADRDQVNLIIRNLINNALKFTPNGGEVTILGEDTGDGTWKFSVQDTGIGMDSDTLERLFKPDFQSKRYGTAGEKGTGLGLILVKDFVEKNNGELTIKSKQGVGSTFSFTLPKRK
ncbi:tetratricopeptide repeat-containing sensor histidine kinase [Lunatimonas salinarum]|uniref:tetratricopeptide repeat-containing sensor histidine kinase n=1 Tax=Lunatimonas salinarum TaxID=1774590 RepID=UPI001ADF2122|nr:tetratricopeptide repeat protein [Lunatimonas salinarum]